MAKAKSKSFSELGIPVGATLSLRSDASVVCKVVDGANKVDYQGEVYSVSGLAKKLMNTPISGYHAFKYNDKVLAKCGQGGTEAASKPAAVAPTKAAVPEAKASPSVPSTPAQGPVVYPVPSESEDSADPDLSM